MEHNYLLNPMVRIFHEQVEPGSTENYSQALAETMLWTAFPAQSFWSTVTKHRVGATEPDNKVMKLILYNAGWSPRDAIMVEIKRRRENVQIKHFDEVATTQLADHMSESSNPVGSKLFGAVVIGTYFRFYEAVLEPDGPPRQMVPVYPHSFFETIHDAAAIQAFFNYVKENIPGDPSTMSVASVGMVPTYSPSGPSVTSASPTASASAAAATESQDVLPSQYYYVENELFYYSDNGIITALSSRPKSVWIYHRNGWSATNRTKKWRCWDGRHDTYQ